KRFNENVWFLNKNKSLLEGDRLAYEPFGREDHFRDFIHGNAGASLRAEADAAMMAQGLTADHAWGFKDPRTPTTFHAWNAAYPDARWLTLLRRSDEVNAAVEKKMHAVFRFRYECIRQSATLVPRERRMTVFYETLA